MVIVVDKKTKEEIERKKCNKQLKINFKKLCRRKDGQHNSVFVLQIIETRFFYQNSYTIDNSKIN